MTQAIIEYLERRGIIAEQDAPIYRYGLQSLFQFAACYGAMLLLAAATHRIMDTVVFWLIFLPIRQYAGGYHASTPFRCFCLSLAAWAAIMAACRFSAPLLLCTITALSLVILWRFSPLPHPNNPLSAKRLAQVTKIIRLILLTVLLCFAVLIAIQQLHFAALICYITLTCALSLLAAKMQRT